MVMRNVPECGLSSNYRTRLLNVCLIKDLTDSFQVELCKSFGDPSKPKAWSKHSQKAPASEKQTEKPVASVAPAGTKKVSLACFFEALMYVRDLAESRVAQCVEKGTE